MATIAFRLDAGPAIGSGHLIRCTALADALQELGHHILFLCRNRLSCKISYPVVYFAPPLQSVSGDSYHVQNIEDELPALCRLLSEQHIECLIVDHYGASEAYFLRLKDQACLVAAIDDVRPHPFPVDIVINGNIYAEELSYPEARYSLLGPCYVLLRRSFQIPYLKAVHAEVKHIYITSGGSDPLCFCLEALRWLSAVCKQIGHIFVIIGPDFLPSYIQQLKNNDLKPILLHNVNMRSCMDDADLFITSAGSTLYELAACGVPNISCILSDNQRLIAKTMHAYGYSCCIGEFCQIEFSDATAVLNKMISNYACRKNMSTKAHRRFMQSGVENVAHFLHSRL